MTTLYEKCAECHLFVELNDATDAARPGIAAYIHLHRGDAADEALDDSHEAKPSGMRATLKTWKEFGPPEMIARFKDLVEEVDSPAGYRIGRLADLTLKFMDDRFMEAVDRLVQSGKTILITPNGGSIRVRLSYEGWKSGKLEEIESAFDDNTSEFGSGTSLEEALRYAMAYSYGGDDDFDGEILDTRNGRWSMYSLDMHLRNQSKHFGHDRSSDTWSSLEDAVNYHNLLHEAGNTNVGHAHPPRKDEGNEG